GALSPRSSKRQYSRRRCHLQEPNDQIRRRPWTSSGRASLRQRCIRDQETTGLHRLRCLARLPLQSPFSVCLPYKPPWLAINTTSVVTRDPFPGMANFSNPVQVGISKSSPIALQLIHFGNSRPGARRVTSWTIHALPSGSWKATYEL